MQNNRPDNKTNLKLFFEAFLEFLRRPKTIFDIKDRLKWLVMITVIIAILEFAIYTALHR